MSPRPPDTVPAEHAAFVCAFLQRGYPAWRVWHDAGMWQARRNTWLDDGPPIGDADPLVLEYLMRVIDSRRAARQAGVTS